MDAATAPKRLVHDKSGIAVVVPGDDERLHRRAPGLHLEQSFGKALRYIVARRTGVEDVAAHGKCIGLFTLDERRKLSEEMVFLVRPVVVVEPMPEVPIARM